MHAYKRSQTILRAKKVLRKKQSSRIIKTWAVGGGVLWFTGAKPSKTTRDCGCLAEFYWIFKALWEVLVFAARGVCFCSHYNHSKHLLTAFKQTGIKLHLAGLGRCQVVPDTREALTVIPAARSQGDFSDHLTQKRLRGTGTELPVQSPLPGEPSSSVPSMIQWHQRSSDEAVLGRGKW